MSRTTYADLFSVIGTSFGSGDGATTFNLPDFRSRVPLGLDSRDEDFDTIGETYGEKEHTLTVDEIPSHEHRLSAGTSNETASNYGNAKYKSYSQTETVSYGIAEATGGSQSHNIVQPSVVTNYIIKAFQSAGVVANVAQAYTESNIDTYSCNYINDLFEYSNTEKVIGKWINGKPLYQKTFYNDIELSTISEIADLSSLSYDYISFYEVSFTKVQTDNNARYWFPVFYTESTDEARVYVRGTDKKLLGYVKSPISVSELTVYVTLRYTKTTD